MRIYPLTLNGVHEYSSFGRASVLKTECNRFKSDYSNQKPVDFQGIVKFGGY